VGAIYFLFPRNWVLGVRAKSSDWFTNLQCYVRKLISYVLLLTPRGEKRYLRRTKIGVGSVFLLAWLPPLDNKIYLILICQFPFLNDFHTSAKF
jgi:hypothetical protein